MNDKGMYGSSCRRHRTPVQLLVVKSALKYRQKRGMPRDTQRQNARQSWAVVGTRPEKLLPPEMPLPVPKPMPMLLLRLWPCPCLRLRLRADACACAIRGCTNACVHTPVPMPVPVSMRMLPCVKPVPLPMRVPLACAYARTHAHAQAKPRVQGWTRGIGRKGRDPVQLLIQLIACPTHWAAKMK